MEYLQNVVSISFWFTHLPFRDIRYVFIFNEDVELHKEKKNPIHSSISELSSVINNSRFHNNTMLRACFQHQPSVYSHHAVEKPQAEKDHTQRALLMY